MNLISYEEFKNTDLYEDFIKENSSFGNLKVQVFTAYEAIPISDTTILITKDIEEYKVVFFRGITDSSGIISDIKLPAPVMSDSLEVPNYTVYELTALNPRYESLKNFSIGMFGDVNVIQYVKMQRELNVGEYND